MSTVEAGGLQGDKVSAIQKRHMVESDTSERKQHSQLSPIVVACCKSKKGNNQGQAVPQEKESLPPT